MHPVNGPGGGAALGTPGPGESHSFRFKALNAGLYVYHCAVAPVAMLISNGMYGLILMEPEGGLSPVDQEYYVMQGEIYTEERFGTPGLLNESYDKLIDERAEYLVFNGHTGALTDHYPLQAKVGETVRIFFGNGGPNYISSFHVIGEIFDRVYLHGSLETPPLTNVQTITVPAGGRQRSSSSAMCPGAMCWSIMRCRAPSGDLQDVFLWKAMKTRSCSLRLTLSREQKVRETDISHVTPASSCGEGDATEQVARLRQVNGAIYENQVDPTMHRYRTHRRNPASCRAVGFD